MATSVPAPVTDSPLRDLLAEDLTRRTADDEPTRGRDRATPVHPVLGGARQNAPAGLMRTVRA
ncbi:hypothetical protein [Kitasatospora sp. NPDC059327]|uniref:hypothetical protein n=1 Tax=Kitasatospora sp. NPDC059327 TaxID=3346803 RepID=UPI00368CF8D2